MVTVRQTTALNQYCTIRPIGIDHPETIRTGQPEAGADMFSIATAVLAAVTTLAQPAPNAPKEGAPAPRQQGERRISVEGTMKIMDRAMEALNGQITDASKRDENLAHVNEMQRGCVIGKGLPLPKEMLEKAGDDAAQAKLKQAYRSHMLTLLKKLISLEEAIAESNLDDAKRLLNEVGQERDRGHAAMGMGDDSAVSPFYPK